MFKKIITILFFIIFSFYWTVTLFVNFPDNYIKITFLEYEKLFSIFFRQKWALFAPPPKSNDRLYYKFMIDSLSDDYKIFEVLGIISKTKRDKFPFGENESIIEYILSNNVSSLTDFMSENYSIYKKYKCKSISSKECEYQYYNKDLWLTIEKTNEVKTLINYGKVVASRNNVNPKYNKMVFLIVYENIKPFTQRDSAVVITEDLVYQSPTIHLK